MKVTDVQRVVVDVPFTERQQQITTQSVSTVYNWSILELCKVTTDTGHTGWGETVIHYTFGRVSDQAVERVIGNSPAMLMNDDSLGAGLQMALFDVVGKILEVPVYQLMGRKVRDEAPISWWSIDASPERWAAEAQDAVTNGYTSFKNKPRPWWDIVEQMEAVTQVVPPDFRLDLDPNSSLRDADTAIPVLKRLEQFDNVAIFESPIPQGDVEGNQRIRAAIDRPIAMHFGSPPYLTDMREAVCDGYVIGGGSSSVLRQGTLAAEADKPFWLQIVGNGLTTAWASHLGAVLSHATWPAITCLNLYSDHLLSEPIEVVDGHTRVPEQPGLGVEVDEETIERHRIPEARIEELKQQGTLYTHPEPELIHTVVYPDGTCLHLVGDGLSYFNAGNGPAYVEGVSLELQFNDGSKEWADLFTRAKEEPISAQWE